MIIRGAIIFKPAGALIKKAGKMAEYETKGKVIRGPFIGSERNALKLFCKMGLIADNASFIYSSVYPNSERCLSFNGIGWMIDYDRMEINPFENKNIINPFERIEMDIKPANILFMKEELGLDERGYVFSGLEYHQRPYKTGLHISAERFNNETKAGMLKNRDYYKLEKFKEAFESLGLTGLTGEVRKSKIISLV